MALVNPIYIPQYTTPAGAGTVLKIGPGGVSTIDISQNVNCSSSVSRYVTRNVHSWGGNIFMPVGSYNSNSQGWIAYNPRTNKFHFINDWSYLVQFVPLGAYIGVWGSATYQRGTNPSYMDLSGGTTAAVQKYDWAVLGGNVFATNTSNTVLKWSYPFSSAPSSDTIAVTRLCAFQKVMYGIYITTTTSYLRKWTGSGWTTIGSGFTLDDATDVQTPEATNTAFFEWGGKLWIVVSYNTGGSQWHRCYEVNTETGGVTERNSYVPASWKASPNHTSRRCFEVIDDTGSTRQVYLVAHNWTVGGWEMYEFNGNDGAWSSIASGSHKLATSAGAVWNDTKGQGCHVVDVSGSVPASYATVDLKVSDIKANLDVDVDLRYEDLTDISGLPPYDQCTEKAGVGSSGLVDLPSTPSKPALTGLSDDFGDTVIDDALWCPTNVGFSPGTRDYGGPTGGARLWYNLQEVSSRIAFGGTSPAPVIVANNGVGIRSKWSVSGAFTVDVTVAGLSALALQAGKTYKLMLLIKSSTNKGYGVYVYKDGGGTGYAEGVYLAEGSTPSLSGVSTNTVSDGTVLRIARNNSNEWSITLDPSGSAEDLTPTGSDYADSVQLWLFCVTNAAANWATASPGPGFSNIAVSGSGAVDLWEPEIGVTSEFMWDHVVDLGAGVVAGIQFHADLV
jgi:hypothetical protein